MKLWTWFQSLWRAGAKDKPDRLIGSWFDPGPWPEEMYQQVEDQLDQLKTDSPITTCYGCGGPTNPRLSLLINRQLPYCAFCNSFQVSD